MTAETAYSTMHRTVVMLTMRPDSAHKFALTCQVTTKLLVVTAQAVSLENESS